MKQYQTIVICKGDLELFKYNDIANKYMGIIQKLFETNQVQIKLIGERKLAYKIRNNKSGWFMEMTYDTDIDVGNKIVELERHLRIDDDVLKFMTIKNEVFAVIEAGVINESGLEIPENDVEQKRLKNKKIDAFDVLFGLADYVK